MTGASVRKRLIKYLRFALGGFAILFTAIVLSYLWMAFAPTGYGRLIKSQRDAFTQMNAQIQGPTLAADIQTSSSARSQVAARDIQQELQSLYKSLDLTYRSEYINSDHFRRLRLSKQKLALSALSIDPSKWPRRKNFLNVARPKLDSAARFHLLLMEKMGHSEHVSPIFNSDAQLDKIEALLLSPNWDFSKLSRFSPDDANYSGENSIRNDLCHLGAEVVRRACRQHQPGKAVQLLERLIEMARLLRLNSFPAPGQEFIPLQRLLWDLGHSQDFPTEGLVRARQALDRAHLSNKQLADFRSAYAVQSGRDILERSKKYVVSYATLSNGDHQWRENQIDITDPGPDPYFAPRFNMNNWHSLDEGKWERLVFRAMHPMMVRALEQGLVAIARGDADTIVAAQQRLNRLARLMNLSEPPILPFFAQQGWAYLNLPMGLHSFTIEDKPDECAAVAHWYARIATDGSFNDDVDMTRLILASAHYRRVTGRDPQKIEDLIPTYLDPWFSEGGKSHWTIWRLEPFYSLPIFPDTREELKEPFWVLNYRFRTIRHAIPMYEELLSSAESDVERETIEQQKGRHWAGRLIFCLLRPAIILREEWRLSKYYSYVYFTMQIDEMDAERREKQIFGEQQSVSDITALLTFFNEP